MTLRIEKNALHLKFLISASLAYAIIARCANKNEYGANIIFSKETKKKLKIALKNAKTEHGHLTLISYIATNGFKVQLSL